MRLFKIILSGTLSLLFLIGLLLKAAVPNDYIANYTIKGPWDTTLGIFVEIDAYQKLGTTIPPTKFQQLSSAFQVLFPKLPQEYAFKVVYEQCNILASQLGAYSQTDPRYAGTFSSFMTNCYKPFSDVLKKVNSQYTILPKAKASPTAGPAPLSVTFDARGSVDPSNETIPSKNFYWYYRDSFGQDQVIGNGPVVNYTFEKEGNYLVHVTVKSSNTQKGFLDGDETLTIDVSPKAATLSVFANGQKMKKENKIKVGTLEAQKGVVLDGSATLAMGGRQILSHRWEITSSEGFAFTKKAEGRPDMIRVSLPDKGEYKVHLEVLDNESNITQENYTLVASDPVAIIKQTPEKGNTSVTFSFDGNASYSTLSSLKLYTWEIFDQKGVKLETFQGKSIKQQFKQPGYYTVKLTVEDNLGQTNSDIFQVYVESTDPMAQFTSKPALDWLYPSRFFLDATISSDIDKTNGYDDLSYDWIFPDEAKVKLTQTEENNGKVTAEFNATGKFKYKVVAKDEFGKSSETEKEIEIKSILRPEIFVAPQATIWGSPLNFVVKTNEPILSYEWDFGDGDKRTIQTDKITHFYQKIGIYTVKLKVNGENGLTNEVTKMVFVGEKDYPIAAYEVKDIQSSILTQNEICETTNDDAISTTKNFAYQVQRYQSFSIDPSLSVNAQGEKADLEYYFQPKNKEIYKQSTFTYKFDEIGCQYVDLTATDTSIGKNNTTRVWFRVVNALPKLDDLVLFFPQYGNELGVGFNQNQVRDIFNSSFDPLIVKVTANNPVDPDGFISYFKRYYHLKDDPARYLETKITPGDIPYAFFSLPRIPGEYVFGITMYDSDGGKISSQEVIGNGPMVFFPPDSSRPDVPLVTLKTSHAAADVGDEITFDVVSKVISDRPDFIKERTIYYDFDGDGNWDLITKKDRVTYSYTKPSEGNGYRPRASVLYRGYRGVSNGGTIIIKNGLKPRILVTSFGNTALFRDISLGDINKKSICPDTKDCTETKVVTTGAAFSYVYPKPGKYIASISIGDAFANEAKKKVAITINTGTNENDINFLSIPEINPTTGSEYDIFVGNSLENTILFDVLHDDSRGPCYGDIDLAQDSDGNGNLTDDHDFACNQLFLKTYEPKYDTVQGRIYYTNINGKILSKDFTVNFLDFQVSLSPESKKLYDDLGVLLKGMSGPERQSGEKASFVGLLKDLRVGLSDKNATMANVVGVKDYQTKHTIPLTKDQDTILKSVFLALSSKEIAAAEGQGEYGIAKADILSILPGNLAVEVQSLFEQFERAGGDSATQISQTDKRKEILQTIVSTISKAVAPANSTPSVSQIDKTDMDTTVMPNICKIMQAYQIPSSTCNSTDTKAVPDNMTTEQGSATDGGTSRLKIVFIVLGSLIGVFVILVVIFAVKAKMNQEKEEGTAPQQ